MIMRYNEHHICFYGVNTLLHSISCIISTTYNAKMEHFIKHVFRSKNKWHITLYQNHRYETKNMHKNKRYQFNYQTLKPQIHAKKITSVLSLMLYDLSFNAMDSLLSQPKTIKYVEFEDVVGVCRLLTRRCKTYRRTIGNKILKIKYLLLNMK